MTTKTPRTQRGRDTEEKQVFFLDTFQLAEVGPDMEQSSNPACLVYFVPLWLTFDFGLASTICNVSVTGTEVGKRQVFESQAW